MYESRPWIQDIHEIKNEKKKRERNEIYNVTAMNARSKELPIPKMKCLEKRERERERMNEWMRKNSIMEKEDLYIYRERERERVL